ncbi:MAG: rhodanese-like domain-containing protein [Candidatus Sericytochromatia bacterium]|nr:rhodanese-like domain-containing protein [Candidatus Sericytochromatia bacterium]
MAIQQLTPTQANDVLKATPDAAFVDVRSQGEFAAGHPAGAINVPYIFMDQATGAREQNADFVTIVQALIPKDKTVVISCLSGGRSNAAAELMAQAGYDTLVNVQGGWGGSGGVPGWQASGLPTSQETGEGVGYDSVKAKAGL